MNTVPSRNLALQFSPEGCFQISSSAQAQCAYTRKTERERETDRQTDRQRRNRPHTYLRWYAFLFLCHHETHAKTRLSFFFSGALSWANRQDVLIEGSFPLQVMPWAVPCPSVHQSPLPKGYMCNWGRDTSAHQALAWLKVSPVPLVSFPPSARVSPCWAGTLPWPSSYPSSLLFPVEVQTLTCLVSSASSPAGPPLLIPPPLQTGLHAAWGRITQFQHSASCCTDPGENSRQRGLPVGSGGKEPTCNAGDLGLIPGLGRSPGEGKGYPLQYPGLENPMDCTVNGVTKSRTWLSNFHFQQWRSSAAKNKSIKKIFFNIFLQPRFFFSRPVLSSVPHPNLPSGCLHITHINLIYLFSRFTPSPVLCFR